MYKKKIVININIENKLLVNTFFFILYYIFADHQLRMKEQQLKFQRRAVESEQYLKKAKNKKKVKK